MESLCLILATLGPRNTSFALNYYGFLPFGFKNWRVFSEIGPSCLNQLSRSGGCHFVTNFLKVNKLSKKLILNSYTDFSILFVGLKIAEIRVATKWLVAHSTVQDKSLLAAAMTVPLIPRGCSSKSENFLLYRWFMDRLFTNLFPLLYTIFKLCLFINTSIILILNMSFCLSKLPCQWLAQRDK